MFLCGKKSKKRVIEIENDWNLFITIYAVMIVIVGVVFFAIIQNKNLIRKKNKAAQYYAASTVKKSAPTVKKSTPNTQAKPEKTRNHNVRHSELYLSYYNNIGTMSFEELDTMCNTLYDYYDTVSELETLTLMVGSGSDKDKEAIIRTRSHLIPDSPYGCRTYGEAHDLVEKAHKDKEYWEYLNR